MVTVVHQSDPLGTGTPRLSPRSVRLIALTDRRGEYRLTNVPEGSYFVVAMPPISRTTPADRRGHRVTYYPSAIDHSEAREVTVRGPDAIEADIRLIPARVSVISGVAIGSNGRPLTNGIIQLGRGAPLFGVGGTTLSISRDGSFTSPALPPGVYSLQTTDGQVATAMSQAADPVMSGAKVTLIDDDVSGVKVVPIRMVAVRGRVIAPGGMPVRGLTVGAIALVSEGPNGPQRPGTADANGDFEFRTWPGLVIVRVFEGDTKPGGGSRQLSRVVRLNGEDVTKTGVDLSSGRDLSGLVIEVSR
jgi:hypothetical protein